MAQSSSPAPGQSQSNTSQSKWPSENDDVYLVAKIGHEKQFTEAINEAHRINTGPLGWRGNAQMMLDLGLLDTLKIKIQGTTLDEKLDSAEQMLRDLFAQRIMTHGEWVTGTVAENREVLFGESDNQTSNPKD